MRGTLQLSYLLDCTERGKVNITLHKLFNIYITYLVTMKYQSFICDVEGSNHSPLSTYVLQWVPDTYIFLFSILLSDFLVVVEIALLTGLQFSSIKTFKLNTTRALVSSFSMSGWLSMFQNLSGKFGQLCISNLGYFFFSKGS